MEIRHVGLAACPELTGVVVVVDVLRSFTTAAVALSAGASGIYAVENASRAEALCQSMPTALTVGSLPGGAPIPGFDFPNSPARLAGQRLAGRTLLMSTAGGMRGLLTSSNADLVLGASMVCASATARLLRRLATSRLTFVITGIWNDRDGDEDRACADLIEALLLDERTDPRPFEARVRNSDFGRRFSGGLESPLPRADLDHCARANRYDFALRVQREGPAASLVATR
ncbi:MAG: 2-phosphosulfolactate phosphatase [Burkholderiales bacterium]|nr:MAG: 2-phosphosulfolactate phosphatase [Burkholderiales bacterium]